MIPRLLSTIVLGVSCALVAAQSPRSDVHGLLDRHGAHGVSVVVAGDVATNAHFFLAALRSIGQQTLPASVQRLQVIVVDTGVKSGAAVLGVASAGGTRTQTHAQPGPPGSTLPLAFMPAHVDLLYVPFSYASTSAAWQEGLRLAAGSVVALWDVYSTYPTTRLQTQVQPILDEQVRLKAVEALWPFVVCSALGLLHHFLPSLRCYCTLLVHCLAWFACCVCCRLK